MAPTLCFLLRGQRSEFRVQGVAVFPETSLKLEQPPGNDSLSPGSSGLLWGTSSKGREGQSEDLQNRAN